MFKKYFQILCNFLLLKQQPIGITDYQKHPAQTYAFKNKSTTDYNILLSLKKNPF